MGVLYNAYMKTAVVLLYGLDSPARVDYREYLDKVAGEIGKGGFGKVVLCGGFTDPQRVDESEASSVQAYLKDKVGGFENFVLEDRSINTNQNLEYAAGHVDEGDEVVVFCERLRLAKVIWTAMHFLLKAGREDIYQELLRYVSLSDLVVAFKYKNLSVVGFEFGRRSKEEMMDQSFRAILDVEALYSGEAERLNVEQRKKDFNLGRGG